MEEQSSFLTQIHSGKNQWWRYTITLLSILIGLAIGSAIVRKTMPLIMDAYPNNDFVKALSTHIFIGVIFGTGLFLFAITFPIFHKKRLYSLITTSKTFDWKAYFVGFSIWGVIVLLANLLINFKGFEVFLSQFSAGDFFWLLITGAAFIGIQSFTEEIFFRGYLLQGLSLHIKRAIPLIISNTLLFGLMHFGYGIEHFLDACLLGASLSIITIWCNGIEFASGVHFSNNLCLSLFFKSVQDANSKEFSWSIDSFNIIIQLVSVALLLAAVYFLFKKKRLSSSN